MIRLRVLARIASLVLLAGSLAHADDTAQPLPPVEPARPARTWLLDVAVRTEIGLYAGEAGDPISVAPDVSLLTSGFPQLEVVHSSLAITGFHGVLLGTSLCVSGDVCDAFSPSVYHDGGVQLSHTLRSHVDDDGALRQAGLSATAGLIAHALDPFALAVKLGLRGSYVTTDLVQLQIVPNVHVAVTERDTQPDRLFVPVTMTVMPTDTFTMQLEAGIAAPLDGFADNLQVPVGVNLDITVGRGVDLLASFTFPAVHGGDAVLVTGTDARVLTLGLRWSKFLGGEE